MRRYTGPVLIATAILIAAALALLRDEWMDSPFDRDRTFSYPQHAVEDADGALYVLDGARRRITKLAPDGTVAYTLNGGTRDEGGFFYADDLDVDAAGNLYIVNHVLDDGGMFMQREEIQRYTPEGGYDRTIYRREYDRAVSTRIQRGEIEALDATADGVRFVELQPDRLVGYELRAERFLPSEIGSIPLADAPQRMGAIAWDETRGLLLSTKSGTIERARWSAEWQTLFDGTESSRRITPWSLVRRPDAGITFVDLASRAILTLTPQGELRTTLDRTRIREAGFNAEDSLFYRIASGRGDRLITTDEYAVVVHADGAVTRFVDGGRLSDARMAKRWLGWGLAALAGAGLLIGAAIVYIRLLRRRISLIVKQVVVLVPVVMVAVFGVAVWLINDGVTRLTDEYAMRISAMSQAFGQAVDPDLFDAVETQDAFWSDEYRAIRQRFHALIGRNGNPWNEDVYFALYRVVDNDLLGFMYQNDRIGMFHPFPWFDDPASVYRQAARGGTASEIVTDVSGDWLYAVSPIEHDDGRLAGIVEVGTDLYSLQLENQQLAYRTLFVVTGITGGIALLLILSTYLVLRSIRELRKGAIAVADGDWETQVAVRGNDEVFELASTFNDMARSIREYMQHIEQINRSYRRFVPEQFISSLGRSDVLTTHLGDQVAQEMTVLFSDIRAFTQLSEQMTPKENFDFLNAYLARVGPFVRRHGGFVDKYIGDAIMALFPTSPDDALDASIEIKRALRDLNDERRHQGLIPVDIGIGIHTGHLMLGIVGEVERLQATVIADAVNVAARLEGLTAQLGAGILISDESFDQVRDPERYLYRYVGRVQVKGRASSLGLYEILDGQSNQARLAKAGNHALFDAGVAAFLAGDCRTAATHFEAVLAANPEDRAAAVYANACALYLREGLPADWDGGLVFDEK